MWWKELAAILNDYTLQSVIFTGIFSVPGGSKIILLVSVRHFNFEFLCFSLLG